jgi:hypothetical protein
MLLERGNGKDSGQYSDNKVIKISYGIRMKNFIDTWARSLLKLTGDLQGFLLSFAKLKLAARVAYV